MSLEKATCVGFPASSPALLCAFSLSRWGPDPWIYQGGSGMPVWQGGCTPSCWTGTAGTSPPSKDGLWFSRNNELNIGALKFAYILLPAVLDSWNWITRANIERHPSSTPFFHKWPCFWEILRIVSSEPILSQKPFLSWLLLLTLQTEMTKDLHRGSLRSFLKSSTEHFRFSHSARLPVVFVE